MNIIGRKVSVASVNGAGGSVGFLRPQRGPYKNFLGSKEHLNWFKIDLNAAEIIFKTINTHKINVNGSTHKVLQLRVKQVIYDSSI